MNLQNLSDELLDQRMLESVTNETQSTLKVLHHLREVDRRRLFSKLKFQSLLDYAEKHLKYPYDQAWRRIEAMRLLKDLPEIEYKIATGELNLTNIGYAQAAFKAEAKRDKPLCKAEKLNFLNQIESQSTRTTQKLVAEKFGTDVFVRETVTPVSKTISMLNLPVSDELLEKIEKLKGVLAHSHPQITTAELLSYACDRVLEKLEKVSAPRKSASSTSTPGKSVSRFDSRYIPTKDKNAVRVRDNCKCTNCGSAYAIEFDHKIPFGKQGPSTAENLRLLCRSCNQRAAIEAYGIKKMSSYLKEPAARYGA